MAKPGRYGATVVVLLLTMLVLLTGTGPGQRALLRCAAWAVSSRDVAVTIGKLDGSLFSQGRIASLSLADADGILVRIDDIRFGWNPWRILGGAIDIDTVGIGKIAISRMPRATTQAEGGARGTFEIPPLRLGALSIAEAVLGPAVLGEAARFSVSARLAADHPSKAISAAITVSDLDRPSVFNADAEYSADTGSLNITATAEEKAGGVLSRLLGIRERGDLRMALHGSGPIDAWRGAWSVASDGERLAGGTLTMGRDTDGLRVATEADGEIGRLLPRPYAELLAGKSSLIVQARILRDETYRLERFQLEAPRVTASASGTLDLARRRIEGDVDIRLRDTLSEQPVFVSLGGAGIEVQDAHAVFSARPDGDGIAVSGLIDAANIAMNGNKAERISLRVSARQPSGVSRLLDRIDAITMSAAVQNPQAFEAAMQPIAGGRMTLALKASKAGSRMTIADAMLSAGAGTLTAKGTLDAEGFDGTFAMAVPDARVFSPLAGRDLTGELSGTAKGRAHPNGALDLVLNVKGGHLTAGADLPGRLLAGAMIFGGAVVRNQDGGVRFDGLALRTDALSLGLDGELSADASSLKLTGRIAELAGVLPASSGALTLDASITGQGNARQVSATLAATDAALRGKPLRDVVIGYQGRGGFEAQHGVFSASGRIGGIQLTGAGKLAFSAAEGPSVRDFELALGENRLKADAALPANGDARGTASLHIAEAGQLTPILGVPLGGAGTIEARLSGSADAPQIAFRAESKHFRYDNVRLEAMSVALDIADALKRPTLSGSFGIKTLAAGETRMANLKLTATPEAARSAIDISARVDDRWQIAGKALLGLSGWQPEAELHDISLRGGSAVLTQQGTARLSAEGAGLRLDGLILAAGKGRISADIALADTLGGKVEIKQFPASFAAIFAPNLKPDGVLEGSIDLAGNASAPQAAYTLSWRGASIAGPLPPGFPALDLSASGTLQGDRLNIDARASGLDGLKLKATGSIVTLSTGATLDLRAAGPVPLSLASAFLAERGTTLDGRADIDLALTGRIGEPALNGRITASGSRIKDPLSGIELTGASLDARLSGGVLRIERLTARSAEGAEVTAAGTLGILHAAKLPVDLQIKTGALHFDNQRTAKGDIAADVTLKGDLNGRSTLSGSADISRFDIQIPQSLPPSIEALELKHKNAPAYIVAAQPEAKSGLPSSIGLSLSIRSANRIFVTGRGLDAQLGGELQLLGSADAPRGIGEFTLERGRMAVLGRTLEFTSGSVTFNGDLDPLLNFLASTEAAGTKIEITLSGQASNPKLSFTSSPELPEDEILALLLFNKSLGDLSPFQVAQLASEVSDLTGIAGGPGILGRLRSSVGLDTLNLTTDKNGESAVSAGSYVNEKLFVGVEQGVGNDSSRVKIDLDITKHLKLRGETGADGQSKLGVGVEWEY